jgi:hypothetical protein
MPYIDTSDLDPFATIDAVKASAMIADAEAQAILVAPCLSDADELDANQKAAVKAVLRGAVLRWNDTGSGALQAQTAGPFGVTLDTRQTRRSLFWPSEIEQLIKICNAVTGGAGGAFSIDTAPGCSIVHAEVCSINFGATYCSCGAILTLAGPLWELP